MNWINSVVRPKINSFLRREMPDNMWVKDPESGQMVYLRDLEANQFVVPGSGFHMRIAADARLKSLFDDGEYDPIKVPDVAIDPLKFRDEKKYVDRLKQARSKTERDDAVLLGEGRVDGMRLVAAVQDFEFMGGSLGMAAGEAIVTGMRTAVAHHSPFILFAASGGARMQEGILSLMQMPRTTVAVQELREAGLPYIVVLTNPTTGGVTASYAMLGDVHIAEPGALICFAGPRVIEQTIREKLPEGFQRAEYLLEHGMVDMVVHRHDLRDTLSKIVHLLMKSPAAEAAVEDSDATAAEEDPSLKTHEDETADETVDSEADAADAEPQQEADEELPKAAEMTVPETEKPKKKKPRKKAKKPAKEKEWSKGLIGPEPSPS
ncbi:MAG: acetyl-CoA carboxylase, carboxyltransferase subunit beta [Hyphomicrobiales bacterium]